MVLIIARNSERAGLWRRLGYTAVPWGSLPCGQRATVLLLEQPPETVPDHERDVMFHEDYLTRLTPNGTAVWLP